MKRTPLKKVGRKQAAINRSYALLKKAYLDEHPYCEVGRPVSEQDINIERDVECGRPASTVHHIRGRGRHTLDVSTFLSVCALCHHWIHFVSPREARNRGYLK